MNKHILHAAMNTPTGNGRWGLPLLIEGMPGTAKSAVIEQAAAHFGLECKVLSPSESGAGAFGVVPVAVEVDGETIIRYPIEEWLVPMIKKGRGLIFLDEMTSADETLQAASMSLLHAKRFAGRVLPGGIRVIGACNPTDIAVNGSDLAPPVANRFCWIKWEKPSVDQHRDYMLSTLGLDGGSDTGADIDAEEARVLKAWPAAYGRAVGLEVGFHQKTAGTWKHKYPSRDDAAKRAWPSDRSWEYAARALATSAVHGLSGADRDALVEGFIGTEAATAWDIYIGQADLPDIEKLLAGELTFVADARRIDRALAVFSACLATLHGMSQQAVLTKDMKTFQDALHNMWNILGNSYGAASDLVYMTTQHMVNAGYDRGVAQARPLVKKANKIQDALKAAGA